MIWFMYFGLLIVTILFCIKDYLNKNNTIWLYTICLILNIYELLSVLGYVNSDTQTDFFSYPISFWIGYFWASIFSVILSFIVSSMSKKTNNETTINNSKSSIEQIKDLKELLDIGAITQEEFEAKKKQLLNL